MYSPPSCLSTLQLLSPTNHHLKVKNLRDAPANTTNHHKKFILETPFHSFLIKMHHHHLPPEPQLPFPTAKGGKLPKQRANNPRSHPHRSNYLRNCLTTTTPTFTQTAMPSNFPATRGVVGAQQQALG